MTTFKEDLCTTTALPEEDRHATAIRILLTLAEGDPTVSGDTLILTDGNSIYLDAARLRRGGVA